MTAEERDHLASAWIACMKASPGSSAHDKNAWAVSQLIDLMLDEPDAAWSTILAILKADSSGWMLEMLSAGPLEDLLAKHGSAFIDRIEQQAWKDSKFRLLLGGVWKGSMPEHVWVRIQQIATPW